MSLSKKEIYEMMKNEKYPLSSKYDPDWIIKNIFAKQVWTSWFIQYTQRPRIALCR